MLLKLIGGEPQTVNMIAPAALACGEVFVIGALLVVAQADAASGATVAVSVAGGIYTGAADQDSTVTAGGKAYVNDDDEFSTEEDAPHFGNVVAVTGTVATVHHAPDTSVAPA